MDKRADRGMSGKMAGKTVKRMGTDSGIGSRKGVKGDKGGVKDGVRDNVKDGVKDRVSMSERDVELLNRYHEQVYEKISPYLDEDERVWLAEATRAV